MSACRRLWSLLLVPVGLAACSSGPRVEPVRVPVEFVYAGAYCGGGTSASITPIRTQDALVRALRSGRRAIGGRRLIPPRPDFDKGPLWLLDMGSMPTAGYGLDLAEDSAELRGSVLTVKILWQAPASEQLVAQVLTYPCLIFQAPASGFTVLRVVDQSRRERARARMP